MSESNISFDIFEEELEGWRLTAVKMTATGAFLEYESDFITWVSRFDDAVRQSGALKSAQREVEEAKILLDIPSDDYSDALFGHLQTAINLIRDSGLTISSQVLELFTQACKERQKKPKLVVEGLMMDYVKRISGDDK